MLWMAYYRSSKAYKNDRSFTCINVIILAAIIFIHPIIASAAQARPDGSKQKKHIETLESKLTENISVSTPTINLSGQKRTLYFFIVVANNTKKKLRLREIVSGSYRFINVEQFPIIYDNSRDASLKNIFHLDEIFEPGSTKRVNFTISEFDYTIAKQIAPDGSFRAKLTFVSKDNSAYTAEMGGTIDVMDKPNESENISSIARINLFEALSLFLIFVMLAYLMIRRFNNKSSYINPLSQNLVSEIDVNIDRDLQNSEQSLNLLQKQMAKTNQEKCLSDDQENLLMETHMPLVVSLEDGRRILVDATDPENITDHLLSDSRCNNPTIASLANIYEEAADRYFARIREINPEEEFSAIQCVIDDETLFADSSLNPRLTNDAAILIAEKIRRTKIIPTFIPAVIMEHYNCDNWRKAFWYVPLAMTAYQFVSPLVVEQNGLWAITKEGGELELVARFEDYETFDLQYLVPESVVDAILSQGDSQSDEHSTTESRNWLCLSLGNSNRGSSKYEISFFEYMPNDGLGNHLIVIKAMLDVWFPVVISSKDEAVFLFDLRTFKHFSDLDSVIDWSISEDTEEEKQFASSVSSSVSSASILRSEADLLENTEFLRVVSIAKKIAIRSGKTELTPLLLLCGLASTDELSIQLTQDNVAKIDELAQRNGILLGDIDEEETSIKMPVSDALRKLIAAHKKASLSVFSLALLKSIS